MLKEVLSYDGFHRCWRMTKTLPRRPYKTMKNKLQLIRYVATISLVMLLSAAMYSQESSASGSSPLPYTPSLDPTFMDRSVDPCVDFYKYSCGAWSKKNPIPADRTAWEVYSKAYEDNLVLLRSILEQAAAAKQRDGVTQKVGDYYASCVDEAAVNQRGLTAIKLELDNIASIKSAHDLAGVIARLQLEVPGSSMMFGAGSEQDLDDNEKEIADLDQGGLGLPNRDYYTNDDAKSKETRERYLQHVEKIFEMLGDSAATAKQNASVIMQIETGLAKASWTEVERRDPYNLIQYQRSQV
jgi:putative endopeptidase